MFCILCFPAHFRGFFLRPLFLRSLIAGGRRERKRRWRLAALVFPRKCDELPGKGYVHPGWPERNAPVSLLADLLDVSLVLSRLMLAAGKDRR